MNLPSLPCSLVWGFELFSAVDVVRNERVFAKVAIIHVTRSNAVLCLCNGLA
jgi:hypothetical protein